MLMTLNMLDENSNILFSISGDVLQREIGSHRANVPITQNSCPVDKQSRSCYYPTNKQLTYIDNVFNINSSCYDFTMIASINTCNQYNCSNFASLEKFYQVDHWECQFLCLQR